MVHSKLLKKPMRGTKKDFNCPHAILSILIYQLCFEHTSTKADEIEKYFPLKIESANEMLQEIDNAGR